MSTNGTGETPTSAIGRALRSIPTGISAAEAVALTKAILETHEEAFAAGRESATKDQARRAAGE